MADIVDDDVDVQSEVDEEEVVDMVDATSRFNDLSTARGPSRKVAYKTAVKFRSLLIHIS